MCADVTSPRRFVLVDHSIAGDGGHYLEYARHVLTAAERAGFKPILVTNRAFGATDVPWQVHRLFERDVWGHRKDRDKDVARRGATRARRFGLRSRMRQLPLRMRLGIAYSRLGLPWLSASAGGMTLSRFSAVPRLHIAAAMVGLPFLYGRLVVRRFLAFLAALFGPPARSSVSRAAIAVIQGLLYPVLWVVKYWPAIPSWLEYRRRTAAFGHGVRLLLRTLHLGREDVVFIPTLSESDFAALAVILSSDPSSAVPSWHVLFRRDIYAGREPSYASDLGEDRVRRALLRATLLDILQRSPGHRVLYYTDTERLTDQYRRLNAAEFTTLPIPVSPALRSPRPTPSGSPLHVVFLGDARTEKGYPLLPAAVSALWREVDRGLVRFTFQSNVNFERSEHDAPVVVARAELRSYPPDVVRLHEHALKTSEYEQLVRSADVILIPYDAARYYARSSGVLVEALTMGVPVVVPAGSWMSDQIQPEDVDLHDGVLAGAHGARRVTERLRWQTFEGQTVATRRRTSIAFGGGPLGIWSMIRPQFGETHVLVQVKFGADVPPGTYCRVWLQFEDRAGTRIATDQAVVGPRQDGRASALFAIAADAEQIQIVLSNAFDPAIVTVDAFDVYAMPLRTVGDEQIPIAAIGCAYADPERIPAALREVVGNYGGYRDRARAFATRWITRHSPERLVSQIADSVAPAAGARHGVA